MVKNNERQLRSSKKNGNLTSKEPDHGRKKSTTERCVKNKSLGGKRERSLDNESQSNPPGKKSRKLYNRKKESTSSDETSSSLSSKSFYGKSKPKYLTPIQRKEKTVQNFEFSCDRSKSLMQDRKCGKENTSVSKPGQNSKRSSSNRGKALKSNEQKVSQLRASVLKKLSPSTITKVLDLSTECSGTENSTDNVDTPTKLPTVRKNKFFKHKSPGKKAKLMLAKHGVSNKGGFSLSFESKNVQNNGVTDKMSVKSKVRLPKCDLTLAMMHFRRNQEKLKKSQEISLTEDKNIAELSDMNSSIYTEGALDFSQDVDTSKGSDVELTVSRITHICNDNGEPSINTGRTSVMSNCSDRWSTCSTGADSVVLLPEPSSDEKTYGSLQYLPDTFGGRRKKVDDSEGSDSKQNREETHTPDTPVSSKQSSQGSSDVSPGSQHMDSGIKSSPEVSSITEVQTPAVNIKEKVACQKLFSIFQPMAESSPHRKLSCTPGGRMVSQSLTPPKQSLLETTSPNSCTSSIRTSPKQMWKKVREKDGREQMMLDCGQKLQGPQPCPVCGMMYTRGDTVDESEHSKMHQRYVNILRFPGWIKERVVQQMIDGSRILMVLPEEKKCIKKVSAVMQLVDRDLGFVMRNESSTKDSVQTITTPFSRAKFFLYISPDKRVVGFCAAQVISKGYRVLSERVVNQRMSTSPTKRQHPRCCSTKPEKACCGVNRIWVLHSERRQNIATKLLDSVRFNFVVGNMLKQDELAFSDPTPDGLKLATQYTGTPHFLVYKPV